MRDVVVSCMLTTSRYSWSYYVGDRPYIERVLLQKACLDIESYLLQEATDSLNENIRYAVERYDLETEQWRRHAGFPARL